MKKIFFLSAFLSFVAISFAQSVSEKDLLVKFSKEEVNNIKLSNPQEYKYLLYCVDHAYYIAQAPADKIKKDPSFYGVIRLKNTNNINFYELGITVKEKTHQAFIIEGTDKVLIVKSRTQILSELNK